jgi:hypothetical protein
VTVPTCVGCIVMGALGGKPLASLMFGILMGAEVKAAGELIIGGACAPHRGELLRGLMASGAALVDLNDAIDAQKSLATRTPHTS